MSTHSKGPTLEQLHLVWLRRNLKRNWPATFQEAMEHPVWSRLLKLRALALELRLLHAERRALETAISSPVTLPRDELMTAARRRDHRPGFWMDTVDPDTVM